MIWRLEVERGADRFFNSASYQFVLRDLMTIGRKAAFFHEVLYFLSLFYGLKSGFRKLARHDDAMLMCIAMGRKPARSLFY